MLCVLCRLSVVLLSLVLYLALLFGTHAKVKDQFGDNASVWPRPGECGELAKVHGRELAQKLPWAWVSHVPGCHKRWHRLHVAMLRSPKAHSFRMNLPLSCLLRRLGVPVRAAGWGWLVDSDQAAAARWDASGAGVGTP